jgi:hypothetical protein
VKTKKALQKRCREVEMEVAPIRVLSSKWARGPTRIENDEIVLDEERAEVYTFKSPEDSERMALDLAALSRQGATEKDAVDFAVRYGLLWHGADDVGGGGCREPLQEWWIEAGRLNLVGALYQAIMDSKRDGSQKPVQNMLRRSAAIGFPSLRSESEDYVQDYIVGASMILQDIVNDGLNADPNEIPPSRSGKRRCWWGLAAVGPGEFRLAQYPPDLLSRAYSAFASLIANNVATRSCKVCGKLFRPKSKRSVACEEHVDTYRSRRWREDKETAGE